MKTFWTILNSISADKFSPVKIWAKVGHENDVIAVTWYGQTKNEIDTVCPGPTDTVTAMMSF